MPDLIKQGFARKKVIEKSRKFFSVTRNKYVQDFLFYVILIGAAWMLLCGAVLAGWNWFVVEASNNTLHPIDFVGAMGGAVILGLLFLLLFGLGEAK